MDERHVGWDSTEWGQHYNRSYYDPSVLEWISDAVMHKTMGIDRRPIRVTHQVVENVLDSFLTNHRPFAGDIHTRYNIPGDGNFSGDFGIFKPPNRSNHFPEQMATSDLLKTINGRIVLDDHQRSVMGGGAVENVGLSSNYIINQVVEFMSEYIKSEYEINTNNKRFSAWSALYGANDGGLRAHSQIKVREKRPTPFQFHMKF